MPEIPPEWLKDVKEVLARHIPNVEVRAFGSRVTGKAKKYSDEESNLPIKVNIIEWATISDSFKKIIEERCEVIQ